MSSVVQSTDCIQLAFCAVGLNNFLSLSLFLFIIRRLVSRSNTSQLQICASFKELSCVQKYLFWTHIAGITVTVTHSPIWTIVCSLLYQHFINKSKGQSSEIMTPLPKQDTKQTQHLGCMFALIQNVCARSCAYCGMALHICTPQYSHAQCN